MVASMNKSWILSRQKRDFLEAIISLYSDQKIELIYETPFQLLVAVILSAQTTDKQVNRVTPAFFTRIREPKDVMSLSLSEIEWYLKHINFFRNKSRFIKDSGTILHEKHHGIIPRDIDTLISLPWVGIKTAKVVLSVLYDAPYVGVDTHIHRVMNMFGIVHTKTPEETDKKLEKLFDDDLKKRLHHPLVLFWRYHATARNPKCGKTIQEAMDYIKSLSWVVDNA